MLNREIASEAKIVEDMHEFNRAHTGISWSYALRVNDEVEFIKMANRPCYGEMRAYGKESTRPGDHKPGDLPRPCKPGIREAVSVYFGKTSEDAHNHNRYIQFCFGPESPWRRGIGYDGLELTQADEKSHIRGVVMTETNVDPTVMVSLFMYLRSARFHEYGTGSRADAWASLVDSGTDPVAAFIATTWMQFDIKQKMFKPTFGLAYFLAQKLDIKKLRDGTPNDLSNGRTWRDGEDYNRPQIQDLFASDTAPITSDHFGNLIGIAPVMSWNAKNTEIDKLPPIIEYIEQQLAA